MDLFQIEWMEEEDENEDDDECKGWWEVNVVATCLKQFFRELPDPLVLDASLKKCIEAASKIR